MALSDRASELMKLTFGPSSASDVAFDEIMDALGSADAAAGVTAGVVTASAPIVAGASKDVDELKIDKLVRNNGTASATAGAATLSQHAGIVTSEALTTAAAAAYTLTITNTKVAAGDMVFASLANGTNSAGIPVIERVTPGSNSLVVVVRNLHSADALNGTIKVAFNVVKAS